MDAREAQERTEKRWLAIIANRDNSPPLCGWCLFAIGMTTENMHHCHKCPVVRVFGESCWNIKEYLDWDLGRDLGGENTDEARKVYELLVTHRDQLITAAKEIENEQAVRD